MNERGAEAFRNCALLHNFLNICMFMAMHRHISLIELGMHVELICMALRFRLHGHKKLRNFSRMVVHKFQRLRSLAQKRTDHMNTLYFEKRRKLNQQLCGVKTDEVLSHCFEYVYGQIQ